MHANSRGFTLIELMIVVAIIAILASLAISAYQTYTVRAQVAEGLNMAANAKVPIVEAYNNDGTAPVDLVAAGLPEEPTFSSGAYVREINVDNGRIDVTFGGPLAHADIVGETLSLTPYETVGNSVIWRCGGAPEPAEGELLEGGADHADPTLDERYMPSVCRN